MHFHRDKLTAMGGPDGGDGGNGGSAILRGNAQMWTLLHLKFKNIFIAMMEIREKGVIKLVNKESLKL